MPYTVMLKDEQRYAGKYVATRTFKSTTALSAGKTALKVYKDAVKQGVANPVITFVPKKDEIQIT